MAGEEPCCSPIGRPGSHVIGYANGRYVAVEIPERRAAGADRGTRTEGDGERDGERERERERGSDGSMLF